jgi:hypothetical protein
MTGHSSLEVLRGYVALAECDLNVAHQKFSPVDNLQLKSPTPKKKKPLKDSGKNRSASEADPARLKHPDARKRDEPV